MEQEMKFEQAKLEQKLKMEKKAQLESTKKHESESSTHTKLVCQVCKKKHRTSSCDKTPLEMLKTAAGKGSVIHPVVVVNENGIKCRALLDLEQAACTPQQHCSIV